MKQRIGLFALIALLACPVFGQNSNNLSVQGIGLSAASLDDNGYFKPKKKKKKKKKGDDEKDATSFTNWRERLWYGAGGTLNFGSNGQSSAFQIGLQPMVGYKIFPFWSVGPRFGLDYISYRKVFIGNTQVNQSGWISTLGAFTRLRFWNFFLHGEVNQQWLRARTTPVGFDESYTVKEKYRSRLVGLGWNEGRERTVGYEFAILLDIDVLADENSTLQPFQFRGALTYNF